MNIATRQILFGIFILTTILGLMNADIARTDSKENGMITITTALPQIDIERPEVTEKAIFALG